MKKFTHAIVKKPCQAMVEGLTTAPELGKPDYEKAMQQHEAYVEALKKCGLEVTVLEADEQYPDSCFVEDPAILTEQCAVITNPAPDSRNGERLEILKTVKEFYPEEKIEFIKDPGTVEGDDIMVVRGHFYVGRSARTNKEGIKQLKAILGKYGIECTEVPVEKVLQLKSAVSYLGGGKFLTAGEFVGSPFFEDAFAVPEEESYGANCLQLNGTVLVPAGCPKVLEYVQSLGYETITVDLSEFRKIDGGLSSLSLRF
ncbi:MAG: N(G),N(G)-dimethylarginine dimethylaminohydrolase [Mogibacterium sp.]|nr:N(G),N(G)-dimethylarginine dimethylaminohydrolase [Mogibacterium sp.]